MVPDGMYLDDHLAGSAEGASVEEGGGRCQCRPEGLEQLGRQVVEGRGSQGANCRGGGLVEHGAHGVGADDGPWLEQVGMVAHLISQAAAAVTRRS